MVRTPYQQILLKQILHKKDAAPTLTPSTSVTGRDANGTDTSIQETIGGKRKDENDDQLDHNHGSE